MAPRKKGVIDTGDVLPTLSFETVSHGRQTLPDAFGDHHGVLLIYRAHW